MQILKFNTLRCLVIILNLLLYLWYVLQDNTFFVIIIVKYLCIFQNPITSLYIFGSLFHVSIVYFLANTIMIFVIIIGMFMVILFILNYTFCN